jgi:carbamoyl-phosphate synthase large subunit
MLRILTEASGSMTSGYLIRAIQEAGHQCVASDVDEDCFGRYLADDFARMPRKDEPDIWRQIESILSDKRIDLVIPSFDETLLGWAERMDRFREQGVHVILSPLESIAICQDKWLTYHFFRDHAIPTPDTSLEQHFPLVKPRCGRGAAGVRIADEPVDMTEMISQELLEGVEYTVDVFCDRNSIPVYIVPRRRINVREGKSTEGIVEYHPEINFWVETICRKLSFTGPVNMQCFILLDGSIKFVEINPRIAGGMALGFAATENWIRLIVDNLIDGLPITPKPVVYGKRMKRYYAEVFIPTY